VRTDTGLGLGLAKVIDAENRFGIMPARVGSAKAVRENGAEGKIVSLPNQVRVASGGSAWPDSCCVPPVSTIEVTPVEIGFCAPYTAGTLSHGFLHRWAPCLRLLSQSTDQV
jgi:hypothetical protein